MLTSFPKINCVTLSDSHLRQKSIQEQCEKYNVDYKFSYAYDGRNTPLDKIANVSGNFLTQMNVGEICTVLSHLKAINEWLNETNDEYGFFCEDDIDLSVNEHWGFTWNELINNLPQGWKCIQLSIIKNFNDSCIEDSIKFHQYKWDNWSACAYIMSRQYAEDLIKAHYIDNSYNLALPCYPNSVPYIENVLYNLSCKEGVYTFPVFTENTNFNSTFYPLFINTDTKNDQKISSDYTKMWWAMIGKFKQLNWFFE
jgi:GR25 family glycosyltransferase involved in LPS biosynthesis